MKCKSLHPDCEYRLWTDEDNLILIRTQFPEMLSFYQALPYPIMRADVIRYLYMYVFGGIYMDMDYEMIRPFDLWDYECILPYNRNIRSGDEYDGIGNCIFASRPKHPFWLYLVRTIEKNQPYERSVDIEASTGPAFITKLKDEVSRQQWDMWSIYMPERNMFHPQIPYSKRTRDQLLNNGITYGIHHCDGTWRSGPVRYRLKKIIKNMLLRAGIRKY